MNQGREMQSHGVHKIEDLVKLGRADVHIHTLYSDGRPTVEEVLEYVEHKTNLDVIAICDHDTMASAFRAMKIMEKKKYRFELVLGEEVSALEGHILALFIEEPIKPNLSVEEVIREIHRQGGLAIASHPFMRTNWNNGKQVTMDGIGFKTLLKVGKELDGIEVVNGTPTLADENIKAGLLNHGYLLRAETGSSDAHIVEAIGKGYTLFEGHSAEEFRTAVLNAQTRGIYGEWTIYALIKYIFFFIPMGLRMIVLTILRGRKKKYVAERKNEIVAAPPERLN